MSDFTITDPIRVTPVADGKVITKQSVEGGSWLSFWLSNYDDRMYYRDWQGHQVPIVKISYDRDQSLVNHKEVVKIFNKIFNEEST